MAFKDFYTKPGAEKAKFYLFVFFILMMGWSIYLNSMALFDGWVLVYFFLALISFLYLLNSLFYSWVLRKYIACGEKNRAARLLRSNAVRDLVGQGDNKNLLRFYPCSLPRWLRNIRLSFFLFVVAWITSANMYRLFFL